MKLTFRPLNGGWRDPETENRKAGPFAASWTDTLELLDREVDLLANGGKFHTDVVLELDAPESAMRLDGGIRADAKVNHPGVVISFESKHGPMRYATDRFTGNTSYRGGTYRQMPAWQMNVRAIALGLEALRKVDRYGIGQSGEQYRGWQALGAGTPMPAAKMTKEQAARVFKNICGEHPRFGEGVVICDLLIRDPVERRKQYKRLASYVHPDRVGGSTEAFQELQEAMEVLSSDTL